MKPILLSFVLTISVIFNALAHHSHAMFDSEKEMIMTGVVTKFEYVNPHSWLYMNIANEDGSHTEWGFELISPSLLRRAGVSPRFWQSGDTVTVKINPLREPRPVGSLVGAINTNNKTYGKAEDLKPPQ